MTHPKAQLGAVTKIVNGGTPDTKFAAYWDGGIAWLTPKDMGKSPSTHIQKTSRTISNVGLENCSARIVPAGSVILSTRAPIGHLAINNVEMAFNQGCRGLVPSSRLNAKFLYYFLKTNIRLLNDLGTGTTFKELSATALSNVQIPLPPLAEQQRIVAILDEAFEGIDAAVVVTQQGLANATSLFDSILLSTFAGLSEQSPLQKLESLTETPITYGVVKPGAEGSVRFVRGGDIVDGQIRLSRLRTITDVVSADYRRTLLRGGELLICLVGQPGQVAVAPPSLRGANIARQVGLIRLVSALNPEYVRLFLRSPTGKKALGAKQSGSVQQVINLSELKNVQIPVLSFEKQSDVVALT